MTVLKNLDEMEDRVVDLVRDAQERTIVIGGHFPLELEYLPGVLADDTFGIFPQYTFGVACRAIASNPSNAKIALIVDDHSRMTPRDWYRQSSPKGRAGEIRRRMNDYFSNFRLPEVFRVTLSHNGLDETALLQTTDGRLTFQESLFRERFEASTGTPAGCAGEYALILRDFADKGIRRVIGMIPKRCLGPTCSAATAYESSGRGLQIFHFYLPTGEDLNSREKLQEAIDTTGGIQVRP